MHSLLAFIRTLRCFAGTRLWIGLALTGAGALLEGVGVLALVPIFSLLVGHPDKGIAAAAIGWLGQIGLETPFSRAVALGLLFLVLIAFRGAIQWLRDMHNRRLSLEYMDDWRRRAFAAVSAAPWLRVISKRRTDIEHSIMVDISRLGTGTMDIMTGTVQVALIIVQLGVIAIIAPAILLVALALLCLTVLFAFPISRRATRQGALNTVTGQRVHHVVGSFMAGQKLARLNDAQDQFVEQIATVMRMSRAAQLDVVASQALVRAIFQWLAALCVVGMLLSGYFLLAIDLPRLIVVTLILMRIAVPALGLMQTVQSTANMLAAFDALSDLIADLRPPVPEGKDAAPKARDQVYNAPIVEVRDIWFAYGPHTWILQGASLEVRPQEIVALDAPSGSGKTTLLDVMTGLLPAHSGQICTRGAPLSTPEDWRAWRRSIAYLPQDPFLFDGTIRENLLWFTPDRSAAEIATAIEIAGAQAIIERCPHGLDTHVSERGQTLSGGERQRICLARALLKQADLLILDEATSAIDEESGTAILASLRAWKQRPAILLVSHRADTRALADRIIPLRNGQVIDTPATPATLDRQKGRT